MKKQMTREFVIFDIETTGLFPRRGDRIIEIGAVLMRDGIIEKEFSSLVNTKRRITKAAKWVHGITNEDLQNAPHPEEVFSDFNEFIKGSTLISHNATFDVSFLRYELQRHRLFLNNRAICTLELSRRRFPDLTNHKLHTVHRHLFQDKAIEQRHRALDDARMVAEIWMAMEGIGLQARYKKGRSFIDEQIITTVLGKNKHVKRF
jgi:DNA polymerase III epsilon subunit